jgi:nucleotide-binding universal stress UspA family protein
MFKRILVAVDASPTGELALDTAIKLAAESQAPLRIVHVVDVVSINLGAEFPYPLDVSESIIRNGQEILRRSGTTAAAAGLAAETNLITIDTVSQRIPDVIADDAEAWSADLIVIGTHGRRGLAHLLLGSVAEGVARVAAKPVLLVRGK